MTPISRYINLNRERPRHRIGILSPELLGWLVIRTSTRLPLRRFFGATGALMFVLVVVFAGKGIAAFHEAGKLPVSPVELLPTIDLLGLYPNLESVGLQLAMLATGAALLYWQRRRDLVKAVSA